MRESLEKLARGYRAAALVGLNIVVFLIAINLAVAALFFALDRIRNPLGHSRVEDKYRYVDWKQVYPDLDEESVERLLHETWSRAQAYEPYTQFTERPFQGEFVNVIPPGFRRSKDQGPWPPDPATLNVFLFGGSTTFGYGVPDEETIASYLQEYLTGKTPSDVRVYNFGRGMYRSSQERILFESLLLKGWAPDLAIFVDGLNDFAYAEGPGQTRRLTAVFDRWQLSFAPRLLATFGETLQELPMARAVRAVVSRTMAPETAEEWVGDDTLRPAGDPALVRDVLAQYRANKTLTEVVAKGYAVRPIFVWQPIPLYHYDLHHHLFAAGGFWRNRHAPYGYAALEKSLETDPLGPNFLWCADVQEGLNEPLYVDKLHYSARMSRLLAERIGRLLIERGLLRDIGPGSQRS